MRLRWLLLMVSSTLLARGQTAEKSILSYKQYRAIEHQNPYIIEFKSDSGMLLFYGAEHTVDPQNGQVADIQERWAAFQPTVAYNEGGNPPAYEDLRQAVQAYGEAGLVRLLAARDEVPVATFEPPFDEEVAYLLRSYTPQQLKVFYALRQVTEERSRQASSSVDDRINSWLARYLPAHGLKNPPNTLAELGVACKSLFPELYGLASGARGMVWTAKVGALHEPTRQRLRRLSEPIYFPFACASGKTRRSCVCCYRIISRSGARTCTDKGVWPSRVASEWICKYFTTLKHLN